MKRTKRKPGYLGPAFYEWLEYLEAVENVIIKRKSLKGRQQLAMGINDVWFSLGSDESTVLSEMAHVDASLASAVRSSVKYRLTYDTILQIQDMYEPELLYIRDTLPIHLPHERCTLVLESDDPMVESYVLCLQEEQPRDGKYTELGIENADGKFICVNMVGWRGTGLKMKDPIPRKVRLSHFPVEIHMTDGRLHTETEILYALPHGVTVTDDAAQNSMDLIKNAALFWTSLFHLAPVLKSKSVGLPPMHTAHVPKKLHKARSYPNFEHFVIELPVDETQADPQGRTCNQPHKRLHQVRGFWRHYKTGKTVWVRPHWRGDEKLGVVRNDYEMTLDNRNPS